jgi:hypothetical protein
MLIVVFNLNLWWSVGDGPDESRPRVRAENLPVNAESRSQQ